MRTLQSFSALAALAATITATPLSPRESSIPTVHFPLHYYYGGGHKIATNLYQPWNNVSIEVVFDQGSENFWVFGPDAISNWGCTALFCQGPCNVTAEPFYDYRESPTASPLESFPSQFAYGAYTKIVRGDWSVNDTMTFAGESGLTSTVEGVRVALATYMQSRLPADDKCTDGGYDQGILGTAPFQNNSEWVTTGPHVRQELLEQGHIKAPVQSMWFDEAPEEWNGTFTGNAVFGAVETSKFTGPLVKIPLTKSDGLGASVGYWVFPPTVSVKGVEMAKTTNKAACLIDSGTQVDDLPVSDAEAFRKALGLVQDPFTRTAWPGPCSSIPADLTVDLHFDGVDTSSEGVTIKVPLRNYARSSDVDSQDFCTLSIDTNGCMLAAPFATATYFAADDAAGEVALAQGGVSKRGSAPDETAMSLTIP